MAHDVKGRGGGKKLFADGLEMCYKWIFFGVDCCTCWAANFSIIKATVIEGTHEGELGYAIGVDTSLTWQSSSSTRDDCNFSSWLRSMRKNDQHVFLPCLTMGKPNKFSFQIFFPLHIGFRSPLPPAKNIVWRRNECLSNLFIQDIFSLIHYLLGINV